MQICKAKISKMNSGPSYSDAEDDTGIDLGRACGSSFRLSYAIYLLN